MTTKKGFDISALKPSERLVEIHHPGDENKPLGIRVTLMSIEDDRLKKLKRQFQDERIRLEARGKTMKAEDIETNRNLLALAAMTGWEWYAVNDGEEPAKFKGEIPAFNPKNVNAVFAEAPWFRDQIEKEIGDTSSFFAK